MAIVTRLLDSLVPAAYTLAMEVDLSAFSYATEQTIDFELVAPSSTLTFHAVGIGITTVTLDEEYDAVVTFDASAQTVAFVFDHEITPGRHVLSFEVTGTIEESLHGFYRSSYKHEGDLRWLVATQFEAVHAREAFVCIDEPSAKAVFNVSITTKAGLTVLSNTDAVREITLADDRVRHDFVPTPKMSTYLLAFVIGELEHVSVRTPEGVQVRAYATAGKTPHLAFALDVAVRSLGFYNAYFDLPYPLSKLDMVAIPDFAAGAMENWGLVTYRETALLLDEQNASQGNRQRVAEVVAHELAHQWFGNLVTMSWWEELWLNEGFASWIEVLAQDELFPEWQMWNRFCFDHYALAMELDSLMSTHPVQVPVDDPAALDEIFDAVSYSKGASVINMLHEHLGAGPFRDGLRLYLKSHQYGNATTGDLWRSLSEASGIDVSALMSAWTSQPGYPVIDIEEAGDKLVVTQARFFSSSLERAKAPSQTWPVPVSMLGAFGSSSELVDREEMRVEAPAGGLLKVNPGQTGFYRVLYHEAGLGRLLPAARKGQLPTRDRFGIVSDLYATSKAGLSSTRSALDATSSLRAETDIVVWQALSGGFGSLTAVVTDEGLLARLERYGVWLVSKNLERLGWDARENEPYLDKLMRPVVLDQAVRFGDVQALGEARLRYDASYAGTPLDPDIRQAVYFAVARTGDTEEFDEMMARYRAEANPQERMRLLNALCNFRAPEINRHVLDWSFSKDVRAQDIIYVFSASLSNRFAREATWAFLQQQWPVLLERYGEGGHMLPYIPSLLGRSFATDASAQAVEAFFKRNPHPAITRPVAQALEKIRLHAAWIKRDGKEISRFLTDWEPSQQ